MIHHRLVRETVTDHILKNTHSFCPRFYLNRVRAELLDKPVLVKVRTPSAPDSNLVHDFPLVIVGQEVAKTN